MQSKLGRTFVGVMVVAIAVAAVPCVRADTPFVDPYDAKSSSGEWVLHVEPSAPGGEGPATYRMTHEGKLAWEATLEYTLRECVVGSSGVTVGYAYDDGYWGRSGLLVVVSVGPDGKVLLNEPHERDDMYFAADPPPPSEPRCHGVLLDEVGQRAILRVTTSFDSDGKTSWRRYDLTDGQPLATLETTLDSSEFGFARQIDAKVIPGTSLVGVHWFQYSSDQRGHRSDDAVFCVFDDAGTLVWHRRIASEYAAMPEFWNWSKLVDEKVDQIEVGPSAFAVVSYAEKLRTKYGVAKTDDGTWTVTEIGTESAAPVSKAEASASVAMLSTTPAELIPVKSVEFGTPETVDVFNDVSRFDIDDKGRIGWVRRGRGEPPTTRFTLVDDKGAVLVDREVDLSELGGYSADVVWLEGDKWLIVRKGYRDREPISAACFYDTSTGSVTRLKDVQSGSFERACRLPMKDGIGFVVFHGFMDNRLVAYDHEGKRAALPWTRAYSPSIRIEDIDVLSDGSLAMIGDDVIDPTVLVFRPGEEAPKVIDIGEAIAKQAGADQNYITTIRADKDGGFIVYDSANENLLHRIDAEKKNWASLHVAGPRGEKFRLYDQFVVAPDGRIWSSDHEHLYRAADDGRAEVTLGETAAGTLDTPCAIAMDERGWFYVLESGTACVHVLDDAGRPVRVMTPNPADVHTQVALAWVKVLPDGRVRTRMGFEAPTVTFDADGTQLSAEVDDRFAWMERERWNPVPGGGWTENGTSLRRLKPDGAFTEVAYRPDGAWLVHVEHASAAPDGSLVVICDRDDPFDFFVRFRGDGKKWLCAFGPDGEPRSMTRIQVPFLFDRLAYDGEHAYLSDSSGVTVVPIPMTAKGTRFDYGDDEHVWDTMLRPDGTLATWRNGAREVQFWKLPE